MRIAWVFVISLAVTCSAWAGVVYKITDADGHVTYSEQEPLPGVVYTKIELPDAVDNPAQQEVTVSESDKINARVDQMQAEREAREKQRAEQEAAQEQARLNAMRAEREALELEKARADLEAAQQPQVIIREVPVRDRNRRDREHHHSHRPEQTKPTHITVPEKDAFGRIRSAPEVSPSRRNHSSEEEESTSSDAIRGEIRLPINIKKDAR